MKALIVYGSKNGGTAGLAHMIATAFEREGWRTDVRDVAERPGIGDVDVVVVGGGLYMNRWVGSVRQWVRQHTPTLKTVPVWFFSSGPLDDSARAGDIAPVAGVAKFAKEIEISGHMTFGGYLDRAPNGFIAKQMAKRSAGDWRDPDQVAEWVHHICHNMRVFVAVPTPRAASEGAGAEPVRRLAENWALTGQETTGR
jgi:menaquinone-dependent protoporphyrinogen oxidase